jgi:RimJ/RimL family protein N-acetyltransferase
MLTDTPQHDEFEPARLTGRHVTLRPVTLNEYESLRQVELSEPFIARWRHRGATPPPEVWAQGMGQGVLAQFLVVRNDTNVPVGMVVLYNADFQHRFAYLAVMNFQANMPSPMMMTGVILFVEYVFRCWDFRKLYVETAEFNYRQFRSGTGRMLTHEGTLKDHFFYDGRYWDEHILALYREHWESDSGPLLAAALPPEN